MPLSGSLAPNLPIGIEGTGSRPALDTARRVLAIEESGLRELSYALDDQFTAAVDLFGFISGHVACTGMGKSGHIARKIAATLASTGTPAFFVHPAEAAHGDLGMITRRDAVLALSDSGESQELEGILAYTQRYSIPLVAITREPQSTLGKAARLVLRLPKAQPACPLRLAPTTSTTMMLALGDALAIALLEQRGFSAEDFHAFHPSGQLGRRLMQVSELMHAGDRLPIVRPDTPMQDVILEMTQKGFGITAVCDAENRLVGVVTDGDLRRALQGAILSLCAADVMGTSPRTITADALAVRALGVMNDKAITSLFVTDAEMQLVGLIHIHDCLRAGLQ